MPRVICSLNAMLNCKLEKLFAIVFMYIRSKHLCNWIQLRANKITENGKVLIFQNINLEFKEKTSLFYVFQIFSLGSSNFFLLEVVIFLFG